jgi:hypothetical protein
LLDRCDDGVVYASASTLVYTYTQIYIHIYISPHKSINQPTNQSIHHPITKSPTHLEAREGGHYGEEARHGRLLPHGLEHLRLRLEMMIGVRDRVVCVCIYIHTHIHVHVRASINYTIAVHGLTELTG